jgi:hypothetical protein
MNKTKILFWLCLALFIFFNFSSAGSPDTLDSKTLILEKNLSAANFKLVTDALDGFGGLKYNRGCDLSIFAGGQPSPIGPGNSTNYKLYAGFIYSTVVTSGDANGDGKINSADVVYLINYQFAGGPPPQPMAAGDANCDGKVNSADIVYLINYQFTGGPPPCC